MQKLEATLLRSKKYSISNLTWRCTETPCKMKRRGRKNGSSSNEGGILRGGD